MSKIKSLRKSLLATSRDAGEKTQHNLIEAGRTTFMRLQSLLPPRNKKSNATKSNNIRPERVEEAHDHDSYAATEALSAVNVEEMDFVTYNICQSMGIAENETISAETTNTTPLNQMAEPDHFFCHVRQASSTISSGMEGNSKTSNENSPATSLTGYSYHHSIKEKMQQATQPQHHTSGDELYETAHLIPADTLQVSSESSLETIHIDSRNDLQPKSESCKSILDSQFTGKYEQHHNAQATDNTALAEELELLPIVSVLSRDDGVDPEDGKSNSSDDDDLEKFRHLMDAVNLPALKQLALNLRQEFSSEEKSITVAESCEIVGRPDCGSYNLVYTLHFDDGVKWIARIPGYGLDPSNEYIAKMNSEYSTMKYIASKTTCKIPKVFYWTIDPSIIGAAFGLISYIEGVPLWDLWIDEDFDEEKRLAVLTDIADEMAKLFALKFPKTGTLIFDQLGKIKDVGHEVEYRQDGVSPWHANYLRGPFSSTSKWFTDRASSLKRNYNPFLERRPTESLLRVVIKTMPQVLREAPLSLSLADLDTQNIFCDPVTGHLTGFIDMDNIHVVPVVIGSAAYPIFLLRDRDPSYWDRDLEEGIPHQPCARFRKHYATAFEAAVEKTGLPYNSDWTRLSHHTCMIERAMIFYSKRQQDIVQKMVFYAYYNAYRDPCYLFEEIQSRLKTDLKLIAYKSFQRLRKTIASGMWVEEDAQSKPSLYLREYLARVAAKQAAEVAITVQAAQSVQVVETEDAVVEASPSTEVNSTGPLTEDNLVNILRDEDICTTTEEDQESNVNAAANFASQEQTTTAAKSVRQSGSVQEDKLVAKALTAPSMEQISLREFDTGTVLGRKCGRVCWKLCRKAWYKIDEFWMPIWRLLD